MSRTHFYRDSYLKTGWLPMNPLARSIAVGDVCHLQQGRFQPLLNCVDAHLVERVVVSHPLTLDPVSWHFSRDAQQVLCETHWAESEEGERSAFTKHVLEFRQAGGYVFSAEAAQARLLTNWHQIRDDVTLKLTQLHYSFREIYVVTGVVQASEWGLVIADRSEARLEMSTALASHDQHALLGHESTCVHQSRGIVELEQAQGRSAYFFKAKKLVLSDATHDRYLSQLLDNHARLLPSEMPNWLDTPLINLVKSNELNLNNSIGFFAWADMNLDDVERLAN